MDLKKLEVLLRAADNGSFVKTAQDLMYTQSGITHIINNMEKELGFPLFIRTNKGVVCTEEAKRILPLVRQLRNVNEALQQECSLIRGVASGNVRIASYSSIAIHWLPTVLESFKLDFPNVHVQIQEAADIAEMEEWLANGYVDLCFFSLIRSGPFEYIDLVDDPMMVVLYPGHPLAKKRAIALEDLKDEPLLLATNPHGLDYDVAKVLSEASFTPRIEATSNLDHIIFSMVQHHLGISIEAALMLTDKENAAVLRPFDPPQSRRLVMAARSFRTLSPAANQFVSHTKAALRKMEPDRILF